MDDLSSLDVAEKTSVMEVRGLDGNVLRHEDGRAFTITYRSKDSKKVIDLSRAQSDRQLQQTRRTNQPVPMSVLINDSVDLLVAATVEWDIVLGGEAQKSDAETFKAVYKRLPALVEQGNEHVGLRANFSKA